MSPKVVTLSPDEFNQRRRGNKDNQGNSAKLKLIKSIKNSSVMHKPIHKKSAFKSVPIG